VCVSGSKPNLTRRAHAYASRGSLDAFSVTYPRSTPGLRTHLREALDLSKHKAPSESTPETLRRAEEEGLNLEDPSTAGNYSVSAEFLYNTSVHDIKTPGVPMQVIAKQH
jgi:hypothetical protein